MQIKDYVPISDSDPKEMNLYKGYDTYKFRANWKHLEKFKGVHPRIYLDREKISELRKLTKADSKYRHFLDMEIKQCDEYLHVPPPVYSEEKKENKRRCTHIGNAVAHLSMVYILTEEKQYFDCILRWLEGGLNYKVWCIFPDIQTALMLYGCSLVYDWLYDELEPDFRNRLKERMIIEAGRIYDVASNPERGYWGTRWVQNHMWISVSGMFYAGLALFDEEETACRMIDRATRHYSTTMSLLPLEGTPYESVDYWFFSYSSVLMQMYLSKEMLGIDMFSTPFFKNTVEFLTHAIVPRNTWSLYKESFPFFDHDGYNFQDIQFRLLANIYKDGHAQWMADQIDESGLSLHKHRWLNLIWHDPSVKPTPPENGYSTFRYYEDSGFVFARSGWEGDAAAIQFRCGPYGGKRMTELNKDSNPWGVGHAHPDFNHFNMVANGEWLFIDDNYAKPKLTKNHSTLIVNGMGQHGEGSEWLKSTDEMRNMPSILKAVTKKEFDYFVGDASAAYRKETGVEKFIRHMVFIKPDVLIVIDDIKLNHSGDMELRFWPCPQEVASPEKNVIEVSDHRNIMNLEALYPQDVFIEHAKEDVTQRFLTENRLVIKFKKNDASEWVNATAISWSTHCNSPKKVMTEQADSSCGCRVKRFNIDGKFFVLNLDTCELELK